MRRSHVVGLAVAEEVFKKAGQKVEFLIGTMIEIPRAALTADQIAEEAEFFSFGTNDLTQMTFGFSRDDIGSFMPTYVDNKILPVDPFQTLDQRGVGQLVEYPYGTEMGALNMVFGAHRDTLAERPDLVRTMLEIHRKATDFAARDRDAMIAMAVAKLGQKREALELSAPNVELTWRLGPDEVRQAQAYAQHMLALKQIKRLPEPGFIDTRFVDAMGRA